MLNALTIDVEDYFQVSAFESVIPYTDWDRHESRVENNTNLLLDMMDEFGIKATFFVLGWVAERNPKLVQEIHKQGHEVASHGYSHKRVYHQSPDKFRSETQKAKKILEDSIGQSVIGYRAASYSVTQKSLWALEILAEEGFRYDSSVFPIWHDLYGIPGHSRFKCWYNGGGERPLLEIPLSTVRVGGFNLPVAGGGYFRLFPYWMSRLALQRINKKENQPAVIYFHPWEIDPGQPRLKGGWFSRFRHYTNIEGMELKVKKLITDFQFGSIKEVYSEDLNQGQAPLHLEGAEPNPGPNKYYSGTKQ